MATEHGLVTRVEETRAWVQTVRTEACQACSAQSSCHAMGGGSDMEVEAINAAGARVGDRVVITFDSGSLLKATFLIYMLPILLMMAGAFGGQRLAEDLGLNATVLSVAGGFVCLAAGLVVVRIKGNRMAGMPTYRPRITRVLPPGS